MDLAEGKVKYRDEKLAALEKKDKPAKTTPFFVEFIGGDGVAADAIACTPETLLDVLIPDMEKCEARLSRSTDEEERELAERCLARLESGEPLCDADFSDAEREAVRKLSFLSFKPVVIVDPSANEQDVIRACLEKGGWIFFYTSGPKESHAWWVKKGATIVECAGRIHTDLARGFIKGDVVRFEDYLECHNMNDCRARGVVRVVDRDYVVSDSEIIEIRFNV